MTYYVVAQLKMGLLKSDLYFVIDYMLEPTFKLYYLLFKQDIFTHFSSEFLEVIWCPLNLFKIDGSGSFNLPLNNQNNNKVVQSAGNYIGSSETIRQLSDFCHNDNFKQFTQWLAGIVDGDGNFDLRKDPVTKKKKLKAIRIKLHRRDCRILTRIQNKLHYGQIRIDKKRPYVIFQISNQTYD